MEYEQTTGEIMTEQVALIIDGPASGSWNMALDRALLEQAATTGKVTVRTYGWEPATVSLGYFQSHLDRAQHRHSAMCPFVRRGTGGGAIVHDQELTYSISLPGNGGGTRVSFDLYHRVHQSLIAALKQCGVDGCTFYEKPGSIGRGGNEEENAREFLCFLRRSPGDVVLKGCKVIGSAQRRLGGALLQHGSVLLSRSAAAPELPGVNELSDSGGKTALRAADLIEVWPAHLESEFGWRLEPCRPSGAVNARAIEIEETVFGSRGWNEKR